MPVNPTLPLKILHVCKTLPHSYKSGIQTHIWKITEWQIKMGHEVHILAAGSILKGYRKVNMDGRIVHEIPYPPARFLPGLTLFGEEFLFNWFAKRWMKKHAQEFDIVHLQNRSGYLCAKVAKEKGVPVLTTLHGMINLEYASTTERVTNRLDEKIHTHYTVKFQKEQLAYSDAVIAVSNGTVEQIKIDPWNWQDFDKTRVIYNGIDFPKLDPNIEPDPNMMIFVGRVVNIKGLFPLIEAMRSLDKKIKLCIVGEGSAVEPLKAKAKEYGLSDRIKFTGALDMDGVYHWIQKSSLLVLPSFYETHGIVLLEANICGKPVIATDITGPNEVVIPGKNGYLVPPNDVPALSEAISNVFDNPAEAKAMGEWGRNHVAGKFDWKIVTQQTIDLYYEIMLEHELNKDLGNFPLEENTQTKETLSTARI